MREETLAPDIQDVCYFAGFFDGEGTISAGVTKRGMAKFSVEVFQVRRAILDALCELFGGKVRVAREARGRQRRTHAWCLSGDGAERFLRTILPHLRVKRREAELALEFRRLVPRKGVRLGGDDAARVERRRISDLILSARHEVPGEG